jgi:hypothetical protein
MLTGAGAGFGLSVEARADILVSMDWASISSCLSLRDCTPLSTSFIAVSVDVNRECKFSAKLLCCSLTSLIALTSSEYA